VLEAVEGSIPIPFVIGNLIRIRYAEDYPGASLPVAVAVVFDRRMEGRPIASKATV
jgi:hypothetical protein